MTKKKPVHAKTKALAAPRRRTAEPIVYHPSSPPRPNYKFDHVPELDPTTRHALVTLESQVSEFRNLESRIADLSIRVRNAENHSATNPETIWHRLQVSISNLQKEFNDRVPALERHYNNVELLISRMDRLEEKLNLLQSQLQPR